MCSYSVGQCQTHNFGVETDIFSLEALKEITINQCTDGQHCNSVTFKKVTGLLIHPSSLSAIIMNENG